MATASTKAVPEIDDRLLAIEREELLRVPTVVAVAAGPEKYTAIRGALRTGCLHVLVTDELTATHLLQGAPELAHLEPDAEGIRA